MAIERRSIVFHGRVQGVGFRYRAKYLASALSLTGWVKNEYDGTVSMEVQGDSRMIDRLLVQVNQGSYIQIDWIDSRIIPLEDERSFKVWY